MFPAIPRIFSPQHDRFPSAARGAAAPLTALDAVHAELPADGESPGGRFVVPEPPVAMPPADRAAYGDGLATLLDRVAEVMPRGEVEAVWAFPGVRREGREYGVAVIERRIDGERRLVYRGRYVVQLKGQERGKVAVELEETAEALPETLQRVLEGVRQRADEAGEAEPVDLAPWKQDAGSGER